MLQQGEIHALREAAERAWDDDTRDEFYAGHPDPALGQCYNTSRWLQDKMGGSVGTKDGHYFWLSPGHTHALDLTADQFGGSPMTYKQTDHPLFKGYKVADNLDDAGTRRFIKRANREFDDLGSIQSKVADLIGDAYPGQAPQKENDLRDQRVFHKDPGIELNKGEYKFVWAKGQLHVSPFDDFESLAGLAGLDEETQASAPLALGYISVDTGIAHWSVQSNVGAQALSRVLKEYTEHVGWKWGGMTDLEGEPVGTGSAFGPKHTVRSAVKHFIWTQSGLKLGVDRYRDLVRVAGVTLEEPIIFGRFLEGDSDFEKLLVFDGSLNVFESSARLHLASFVEALNEYAADSELTILSGNDNVIKRIEDLETDNLYSPNQNQDEQPFFPKPRNDGDSPERGRSGLYRCPYCDVVRPTWGEYLLHVKDHEKSDGFKWDDDSGFPDTQMGDAQDSIPTRHFEEQEPFTFPIAHIAEARRIDGFRTYAKAFRLDTDQHKTYVSFLHGAPVGWLTVDVLGRAVSLGGRKTVSSYLLERVLQDYPELEADEGHLSATWLKSSGFTEVNEGKWKIAQGQDPKDMLEAEVPFIYDVQEDSIHIGHPGQRTSDIIGQFTPGGIVEGIYEPGGAIKLTTMTNMPYTVRHMIQLWYAQHPQLEVKSVHLQDEQGKDTKLASRDLGQDMLSIVAQDHAAQEASTALMQAGGNVFSVGGSVRDLLLGKVPKDIDLMVQGMPDAKVNEVLKSLPGRVDYTGKDFGVYRYRSSGGDEVEIALPRVERSTGEGHKDFDVQADHTLTPEQDLYRRDFTVNSLAVNLATGQVLDPFGGANDLAQGNLRTIHEHSLAEDPLRTMRALVAHGRYGLEPTEGTRAQMAANASGLDRLPAERIQPELDKIMKSANPAAAIRLAHETGVLPHFLPEVDDAFGYDQNNPHHELELGEHLLNVLDRTAGLTDDPDVRLAALLHDIGKPGSAWMDPETGSNHFYKNELGQGANHEELGADMANERLHQLRYPNDRIDRITDLVQHHMFPAFTTEKGARKFINRVGDHAEDLMDIREADNGGKTYKSDPRLPTTDMQRDMIQNVRAGGQATNRSQLAVNGNDLIQLGIPSGPQIGHVLNQLTQAVVDDPALNDRDTLLGMANGLA
jgi:tRNA nucleotidyltransferase (CCA-adding enzyme)